MVPDIIWEEPWTSILYTPCAREVLITLDMNNFAETLLWIGSRLLIHTAIRGAWILAVYSVHNGEVYLAILDDTWASAGFHLLLVYKEAEGGLWMVCDTVPVRMSLRLAEHRLGWADATEPSTENVLIIIHSNNFPLTTPVLQACWWCPKYVLRFITNNWMLGIVDMPSVEEPTTQTLSCWVRGLGLMWTQDVIHQSCTLLVVCPLDRLKCEVLLSPLQRGARSFDISIGSSTLPSIGAN